MELEDKPTSDVTEEISKLTGKDGKEVHEGTAEQSRAEQSRAEQSRAEQSIAEQSRADIVCPLVPWSLGRSQLTIRA